MRFIKKHKYKLLTLMLSIVSIFTLFLGINKTYAYETDKISYTINYNSISTDNIHGSILTDNNYIELQISKDYISEYPRIVLPLLEDINNTSYQFLINFDILGSNDNITYTSINNIGNDNKQLAMNCYYGNNNTEDYKIFNQYITLRNQQYILKNYYTMVFNNVKNTYQISTFSPLYLGPRLDLLSSYQDIMYWKFRIYNVDFVKSNEIGLQQYYDTYYGNIEESYNQLQSDYNDLQDDYQSLEDNYDGLRDDYNSLHDDYDTLQDNYNSLNTEYNQSNMYYQYGALAYINNLDVYSQGPTTNFTFEQLTQNEFIIGGNKLYLSKIIENTGYYGNNYIDIYFNPNLYLSLLKFNLSTEQSYPSAIVFGINRNDTYYTTITINLQNYNGALIDYDYLLTFDSTLLDNDTISEISIESVGGTDFDRVYMIFTNLEIVSYNNGFNNGYQKGVEHQQRVITDLNNQITILTSRVTNLEYLNQALNEQINSFNSDYNLNNLMWTIASTPFDSFKQIWNVDFFGVNISSVITGFLTGIIVLWIIKKFFL